MKRLTRHISKKQDYCEFEIKNCKYQDIYNFENYSELEDYVDCDLTLAIDKLGHLEDIEELCNKMVTQSIYEKIPNTNIIYELDLSEYNVSYDFENNFIILYKGRNITIYSMEDYDKTWSFSKGELE